MHSRKRLSITLAVLLFLTVLACGSNRTSTGNQGDNDTRPTREAAISATEAPPPAAMAAVGEDVMVGDIRWKVLEAKDLGQELKADNDFTKPKKTSGKFVLVRFEIENRKSEAATYVGMNLIDDKARKFEPYTERVFFISQDETCVLQQLNPNLSKTCTEIFEVPGDATGIKAILGDLEFFGGQETQVSLGF